MLDCFAVGVYLDFALGNYGSTDLGQCCPGAKAAKGYKDYYEAGDYNRPGTVREFCIFVLVHVFIIC